MFKIVVIICFLKVSLASAPPRVFFWLIQNVGQGQWVVLVDNDRCTHYDFGGERQFTQKLRVRFQSLCAPKKNELVLSHPDLDHYSFLRLIEPRARRACWLHLPARAEFLRTGLIPYCETTSSALVFYENRQRAKNDNSSVHFKEGFLIPGDSAKRMESKWIKHLSRPANVKVLILGHHGSRTSTGPKLVGRLTRLKFAVVTARSKRYNHPHPQTLRVLQKARIPVLKTEDWGTILVQLI